MAMHVIKGSKFLRLQKNAFWVGISHPNHLAHFFTKRKILTLYIIILHVYLKFPLMVTFHKLFKKNSF